MHLPDDAAHRRQDVALLAEGVDRNPVLVHVLPLVLPSPSSRRAWIEIFFVPRCAFVVLSPSSRRAWIEISYFFHPPNGPLSPSSRRAWIEIRNGAWGRQILGVALLAEGVDRNPVSLFRSTMPFGVALLAEGVDRNLPKCRQADHKSGRPPRGGRG